MRSAIFLASSFCFCITALASKPVEITVWRHETGDKDMKASAAAEERFNRKQSAYRVVTETLPQGSYQQSVIAAAMTKKLPCVLDLDQPTVPNFAWAGHIQPLEGKLKPSGTEKLIPGGQSVYKSKLYAVGQFDVALALFAHKSSLVKSNIRIASIERPYSSEEFRTILQSLKKSGYRYPLDLNAQFVGEWITYAFSPWFQSAGADLIDRSNFRVSEGKLNGDKALAVADYYASLFNEKLAARKPIDDQSFPTGRSAFHYTGSWALKDYFAKFRDDLLVLPPPAFGAKPRIGAGSWQWAISTSCPHPEGAKLFLEHLISTEEIVEFSNTTGLLPTSEAAANATSVYKVGGLGRGLFQLAQNFAVVRPETPAYPMISSSFERAMKEVREGVDSADALDRAVEAIQQDLKRNNYYGY